MLVTGWLSPLAVAAGPLKAGVAKVEITDRDAGPVHDPSYVKALAISDGDTTAVLITVDAVAIGGIGRIPDGYLPRVGAAPRGTRHPAGECRRQRQPLSHAVRGDTDELTVQAVKEAWQALTPVKVGRAPGRRIESARIAG